MERDEPRRVILCLRYGIGDVVLQSSLFPDLRRAFPGAHLVHVGARPATELLVGHPCVDEVRTYQDLGARHWGDPGSEEVRAGMRRWLEEVGPDLVLDPDAAPFALRREVHRLGIPTRRCDADAVRASLARGEGAAGAIRAGAAAGWGIRITPGARPTVPRLAGSRTKEVASLLPDGEDAPAGADRRPVVLAPVGGSPLKRWPADRFAALCRRILDDGAGPVVVVDGPDDGRARRLVELVDDERVRLAPVLPLPQVAELLEGGRVVAGHDTGLVHMASALEVPVVAIFGPSSPEVYAPRGGEVRTPATHTPCILRSDGTLMPPECIVRGRCLLGLRSCIDEVPVERVHRALRRVPAYGRSG